MGVLACDRNGCEHIMCDRCIVRNTYYICDDCWEELLAVKRHWEAPMTAAEVEDKIHEFMETRAGSVTPCDIEEKFRRLTGTGDER